MKNALVLLLVCVIALSTTGFPSSSYSNVRLQKSKPKESPPSVGSSIPIDLLSNPELATKAAAPDSPFEKEMENLKNAPQEDEKVLGKRNVKDNGLDELSNGKDIEKGIVENIDGIDPHYDDFLENGSEKAVQEFDDDNAANDKFDYKKLNAADESSNNENKTEDDLEKSNSFVGVYGGCCGGWGGWGGGWGGYGGWGGWGGGWGGYGGWGGWGGGWGGPWYG